MNKKIRITMLSVLLVSTFLLIGCSKGDEKSQESAVAGESTSENSQNINISNESDTNVTFLNTGNSDAILIEQAGKYMLIDSGDNDDEKFMVDYLKENNISSIDYFLLSHFDADHIGGADAVIGSVDIKTLLVPNGDADTKTYRDFITAASNKDIYPSVPLEGSRFDLGNAYFEVFNTDGGGNRNDDSLVVKLTNGEDKFAFMGDASKVIEKKVVDKIGKVDILKAGHHGSHTSSGYDFVKSINPKYAILMCSSDNKYGHPHKETVDTFKNLGVEVHRSDECGDIQFKSSGNGVTTSCNVGSYNTGVNSKYSNSKSSSDDNLIQPDKIETNKKEDTVYWTPNGEVYHIYKNCSTLSRSKVINEGSKSESGKDRAHKNCSK